MKNLTILICVLAMLLALTGVALASPDEPRKFRIEGYTISFDPMPRGKKKCTVLLLSRGKVTRHIQGTFTMSELLHFHESCSDLIRGYIVTGYMPLPYSNKGSKLTVEPKKGDPVTYSFKGGTDGETVSGTFYYDGTQVGQYEGVTDDCDLYIPPSGSPELVCTGFYVDFTFDYD